MITLLTGADTVPPGTCPFCGEAYDQSGCRVLSQWHSDDLRASGGVERVVDIRCVTMASDAEPTPQQMGRAIQKLREVLRLSVKAFANACGLSAHRLREIESGAIEATSIEHGRILKALGVRVVD